MIDIFTGIPYTVQVPYEYRIFHTKLVNKGLEVVIREELNNDQWKRYEIFQDTLGGRPLTLCRKSATMYGAIQTAGAKQLPSQACFIVPIAAARCMSTAPTTASAFLNTPAHSTPKFLAEGI